MSLEKIWLDNYRFGRHELAHSLEPYPELPLDTILDQAALRNPASIAIDYCGCELSYGQLKDLSERLAAALSALGVKKGDRVVNILPNCPQYIISAFAILKAGAVHVPCSILHPERELQEEISACGAQTVICPADHFERLRPMFGAAGVKNVIITARQDYGAAAPENPPQLHGAMRFTELIAGHEPRLPAVKIDPKKDLAYLAFTGGATGRPKGVMLTHFNRLANVLQGLVWTMGGSAAAFHGRVSMLITVPLFHSYGDWLMLSAIYLGLKIILAPDPRDIDTICSLIVSKHPDLVGIVPTQLMKLSAKDTPLRPVKMVSGSSFLPAAVRETVSKKTSKPISGGYGLTEAGPTTHIDLCGLAQANSIGVPVPDTEIKLINEETGAPCGIGEAGHMYIKGPQVMLGYWPEPGSGLVDGWLPTGDVVRMDERGYFYLVDRIKDMANVSGYKVYTGILDDLLFKHPAVLMAVTIGVPDPERPGSERIKAFIKLKDEYRGKISAAEIIEFCKEKCPPYAVPKYVEFRDDLPLTVTDKLFKRKLREEERRRSG